MVDLHFPSQLKIANAVYLNSCPLVCAGTAPWRGSMWTVCWLSSTSHLIKLWGTTTSTLCQDDCTPSTSLKGACDCSRMGTTTLLVCQIYGSKPTSPPTWGFCLSVSPATVRRPSSPLSRWTTALPTWTSLWWAAVNRVRAPATSCGSVSDRTWASCSGGLKPPTGSTPGETHKHFVLRSLTDAFHVFLSKKWLKPVSVFPWRKVVNGQWHRWVETELWQWWNGLLKNCVSHPALGLTSCITQSESFFHPLT